jgi:ABC-type multidrug transport system ATPase subunit
MPPTLLAEGLGKRFGRRWVVRGVSLEVGAGDRVAVVGPNGSGKSTLVKILAGLVAPSVGTVRRPTKVGYMALDLALYPSLSAREHLEWAGESRGCDSRASELIELVGLQEPGERPVGAYSSGMKARLKLAIAIQHHPEVLFLDEPTAPLDEVGRELVRRVVKDFSGAVVIATNDPEEKSWATREIKVGTP